MSEPEPCPFCGQAPKTYKVYQETGSGDGRFALGVKCDNPRCGVAPKCFRFGPHGYRHKDDIESNEAAAAAALAAWNTRAPLGVITPKAARAAMGYPTEVSGEVSGE